MNSSVIKLIRSNVDDDGILKWVIKVSLLYVAYDLWGILNRRLYAALYEFRNEDANIV